MKTIYPFMGLALCSVTAQAQEKPNFLIIQCDHLTQRVVGAYGQTQGCTLPIDEVASRGVIFSNAYVGCPLSQPSRAALWSGMMPHQTNVRSNSSEPINPRIPENVPTLGSLFSERSQLIIIIVVFEILFSRILIHDIEKYSLVFQMLNLFI